MRQFAVGITGASGAPIADRLVRFLLEAGHTVHVTLSRAGRMVVQEELGQEKSTGGRLPNLEHDNLHYWSDKDFYAPFASGSARVEGMIIVPCTMGTVGAIAAGTSDNLLRRGADVMLKERRPLILVPREAPLSEIHLQNLLTVTRAGATIIPPILTFYQGPSRDVGDQIEFIVSRILDHLHIDNELFPRWASPDASQAASPDFDAETAESGGDS